jgi:[ribosomal protein S5]-alanine N-acetyltransferase
MSTFDLSVFEAPLTVPQLQSGPVVLRPFLLSDLPLIRQAATDPYIPAVTSVPSTYSDDGGRAFIERQQRQAVEGNGYVFVIADSDDPRQAFGGLGMWLHEIESGRASIGYWVIPAARGQRRAGWALRAMVTFAFGALAIPRLHLFVEPWNIASQRTAEFAGFTREALLHGWERINHVQSDVYAYCLLRDGWESGPDAEHTDARA